MIKYIPFRFLIIGLILLVSNRNLNAHGVENFTWTTLNVNSQYDFNNSKTFPSVDLNTSFVVINAGLTYKSISYIDKKGLSFYIGLGMGNILQIQPGFSPDGFSLRFRSDWIVGQVFEKFSEKHPYLSLTTFSFNAERYYKDNMKWYIGAGIGVSLHTFYGFKFFKKD